MRSVTLDIETIGDLSHGDLSKQEITVVGIHDSMTDSYTGFFRSDLDKLWPILERADVLIGYNSDHFDIPILNRYYSGDLTRIKSVDLLKEIRSVLGRRLRLDNIAQATLGKKKIGHGLDAMEWWSRGDFNKVRDYCLEDVRITKEIYEYAQKNMSLKYKDFDGIRDIRLDTAKWNMGIPDRLTHTLPFE